MKNRKILVFSDFVAVFAGMLLGYAIRFSWEIFPDKGIPSITPYLQISIFTAFVWILMLSINRIYSEQIFVNPCFELSKIIQSSFYSSIIISATTFFYRGFSYSRIAVGLGLIIGFLFLSLIHLFLSLIPKKEETKFLLVGNKEDLMPVLKRLEIKGVPFTIFLSPDELLNFMKIQTKQDFIAIICFDNLSRIQKLAQICNSYNIPYFIYPKTSQFFLSGGRVEEIDGLPVLTTQTLPLELWHNKVIKRIFDIITTMVLLTFFLPFFIFIAIIIRIDSPGPVLFIQERVGFKNKRFKIIKFRTMFYKTQDSLPYTIENDPRITKTGRILRKFNLDELPQFFNVLKGEMSLIGPRPISIDDKLFFTIAGFNERMKILPGMTGWAQIHGLKGGQFEPEERFRYDLYYAENWSIWLDFAIIVFTIFLFFSKNKGK